MTAGLAYGAAAGVVEAAPTGELAALVTVPASAVAGGLVGGLGGLAVDLQNQAPTVVAAVEGLGGKISKAVTNAVRTAMLLGSLLLKEPDLPPPRPTNEHKPPPPVPTSTKTVVPDTRDRDQPH